MKKELKPVAETVLARYIANGDVTSAQLSVRLIGRAMTQQEIDDLAIVATKKYEQVMGPSMSKRQFGNVIYQNDYDAVVPQFDAVLKMNVSSSAVMEIVKVMYGTDVLRDSRITERLSRREELLCWFQKFCVIRYADCCGMEVGMQNEIVEVLKRISIDTTELENLLVDAMTRSEISWERALVFAAKIDCSSDVCKKVGSFIWDSEKPFVEKVALYKSWSNTMTKFWSRKLLTEEVVQFPVKTQMEFFFDDHCENPPEVIVYFLKLHPNHFRFLDHDSWMKHFRTLPRELLVHVHTILSDSTCEQFNLPFSRAECLTRFNRISPYPDRHRDYRNEIEFAKKHAELLGLAELNNLAAAYRSKRQIVFAREVVQIMHRDLSQKEIDIHVRACLDAYIELQHDDPKKANETIETLLELIPLGTSQELINEIEWIWEMHKASQPLDAFASKLVSCAA